MAKLYFYWGAMSSSKSASLLMNVHNYEQQGKRVMLLKPAFDSRNPKGIISSRIGLSHEAYEFNKDTNLQSLVFDYMIYKEIDCIFIDEIHFATRKQIREIVNIVDILGINVICYGLKNSYIDGKIFDTIQELLYQANNIYEIKSTCQWCNSKATHHLYIVNGTVIRDGDEAIIGDIVDGDEKYISCCRKHYYNPPKL